MRGRGAIATAIVGALLLAAPGPAAAEVADPLRSQQYGLDILESDAAHATTTGAGATIAIVDTGVLVLHPDLAGRLVPGYDFVENDAVPQDGNGHGTHVLGIAGAASGNGIGVSSVAPGAKLMPVRVLGDDGSGSTDDVARGIDYAVAHGADVINLSLGSDIPSIGGGNDPFDAAIGRALDAGRVVVAASGNSGLPTCSQPSGAGRLLCVGSVDENRQRSFFSNFGGGLGVMAPGGSGLLGRDILSTANDGAYTTMAGTSQAAPHVAGVAALLVSRGLRGQAVVNRILATASDAGSPGPDPQYGAGIVNARRAVEGLPGPGGGAVEGLPGPGGGASQGGSAGSAAVVSFRRPQRIRTVLRRGLRVRCRAAGDGLCAVRASRRGRRFASGSMALRAGRTVVTVARLNRRGRTTLRRALRRKRAIALRVRVTLPGAAPQQRRLKLRP